MAFKVDGVASPTKVCGSVAAKVCGVTGVVVDPYWPVTGVTKPQHLWPFSQTGDYTDQGSVGGLTLTPANSQTFITIGVYNPASIAVADGIAVCADNVYSILVDFFIFDAATTPKQAAIGVDSTNGWNLYAPVGGSYIYRHAATDANGTEAVIVGVKYQMIIVSNGTGNALAIYLNGALVQSPANAAWVNATGNLTIGNSKSVVYRMGFLNGTAWDSDDVTAIYNSTPAVQPRIDFAPHNMTSAVLPAPYVVTCSSEVGTYEAYKVFSWAPGGGADWLGSNGGADWVQIDLGEGNEKKLYSYGIQSGITPARNAKEWTMQGSNDDINWDVLDTVVNQINWAEYEVRVFTCDVYTTSYRYFRLNITDDNGDGTYVGIRELFLYS